MKALLLCLLFSVFVSSITYALRRPKLKPPELSQYITLPDAQWIYQKLDHFATTVPTYWKQRYFVNASWWDGHGPVFLLLGGEGPASPAWLVIDTSIMVMAKKYGALVFSVEHR